LRHDLTSTTAKPITNGPSYTTRWDVTLDAVLFVEGGHHHRHVAHAFSSGH